MKPKNAKDDAPTVEEPPLFKYIRTHELGADLWIETPFGGRPVRLPAAASTLWLPPSLSTRTHPPQVLYADYTASGRALSFIEDYVRTEVLPTYGNTPWSHTAGPLSPLSTSRGLFRGYTRLA